MPYQFVLCRIRVWMKNNMAWYNYCHIGSIQLLLNIQDNYLRRTRTHFTQTMRLKLQFQDKVLISHLTFTLWKQVAHGCQWKCLVISMRSLSLPLPVLFVKSNKYSKQCNLRLRYTFTHLVYWALTTKAVVIDLLNSLHCHQGVRLVKVKFFYKPKDSHSELGKYNPQVINEE